MENKNVTLEEIIATKDDNIIKTIYINTMKSIIRNALLGNINIENISENKCWVYSARECKKIMSKLNIENDFLEIFVDSLLHINGIILHPEIIEYLERAGISAKEFHDIKQLCKNNENKKDVSEELVHQESFAFPAFEGKRMMDN